jgi:predicted DNA-binding transcriptional regulator AlpA
MVSRGQIPHLRLTPRVVRFDLDEIAAWLETKRRGGSGGAP